MTIKQYLQDSKALRIMSTITAVAPGEKPSVRLSETIFHPQGGGQQADHGFIGAARVLHVEHAEGGEVDHYLESLNGLLPGQQVEIQVDEDRRRLNARLHSAGHLVAGVGETLYPGIKAVSGHHWPGESRVEFTGDPLPNGQDVEEKLPGTLVQARTAALPIMIVGDPFSARTIQIGDYRPVPCGGTHLDFTSDIGEIAVKAKIKGGRLRLSYRLKN